MSDSAGQLSRIAAHAQNTMGILKQDRDERNYSNYARLIQDSPDDVKAPNGVDYRVWNKAVVDHLDVQMKQGDMQKQRTEMLKAQMESGRESLIQGAQQAESIATTNAEAGLKRYMEEYTRHPNGISTKYNEETKAWDFTDEISGSKWSDNLTIDDARQMVQAMVAPGAYEQVYLTDRSRVINYNKIAATNPDILEDKNGEKLTMFTFVDQNTGRKAVKYVDHNNKEVEMTPDELVRGGWRTAEDNYEERMKALGLKKKEKDIENIDSSIESRRGGLQIQQQRADAAGKKSSGSGLGALDKNVAAVMEAYDVNKAEAMDILRKDKNFGTLLRSAQAEIEEEMLDTEDPEDVKRIESIYKKYGVDKLPGSEGLGLRGEKGAETKTAEGDEEVLDVPTLLDALKKQFPNDKVGTKKRHSGKVFIKTEDGWKQKE